MSEHNPWDKTIWDPIDPEQAIEDLLHGPSAMLKIMQIPAMPLGDGTYYQPGRFYLEGTPYIDAKGRSIIKIGSASLNMQRALNDLREWIEVSEQGEDALISLEASRQQQRLKKTGFANCFKLADVCPGGKKLADCEPGSKAYNGAQEWSKNTQEAPKQGRISNLLARLGGKCISCSLACEVSVKTIDGKPEETRVSFYKPVNLESIKIRIQ